MLNWLKLSMSIDILSFLTYLILLYTFFYLFEALLCVYLLLLLFLFLLFQCILRTSQIWLNPCFLFFYSQLKPPNVIHDMIYRDHFLVLPLFRPKTPKWLHIFTTKDSKNRVLNTFSSILSLFKESTTVFRVTFFPETSLI